MKKRWKTKHNKKTLPFLFFVPFELKKKLNQSHIFFLFQSVHIKLKQFNDAWIEKLNLSLNFKNSRHDRRMWEGREDRIWCLKRKGFYEVTSDRNFCENSFKWLLHILPIPRGEFTQWVHIEVESLHFTINHSLTLCILLGKCLLS